MSRTAEDGRLGTPVRRTVMIAAPLLVMLVSLLLPTAGTGRPGPIRGFGDPVFLSSDGPAWLNQAFASGARVVRLGVHWSVIAGPRAPVSPRNPGDRSYDFAAIDTAVRAATAAGLDVMLTINAAPAWAEGAGRPATAIAGTWKPDPIAYGDFSFAVARRYSGSYVPRGSAVPLPHVRFYQAWNEPNLDTYLAPQIESGAPVSPIIYTRLLNDLAAEVNAVDSGNTVVTAGTAPFGDQDAVRRLRPLRFWRQVLCLKGRRKLKRRPCATRASFDILAHHPINPVAGPRVSAAHPDDVTIPDMRWLRRTLRVAERKRTVEPAGRHRLWATELWWETDPPDPGWFSPKRQARWIQQALYYLWRQQVKAVFLLPLRDAPEGAYPGFPLQSGIFFSDGVAKPSAQGVSFPFVAQRRGRHRVRAWLTAPRTGRVVVRRRRRGRWIAVGRRRVSEGQALNLSLRTSTPVTLQAKLDELRSLPWRVRG